MAKYEQEDSSRPDYDSELIQLYFSRVRPIYHQLFNMAHAVTGNSEQASYCVQYAMLDSWAAGDASASRHGFREGLRSSAMEAALRIADTLDVEEDWDGLRADSEESDALMRVIGEEEQPLRRILALRWGCGLSPRRIADLTGEYHVSSQIRRFEQRAQHKLEASRGRVTEAAFARAVRRRMTLPSPLAPDINAVFHSFAVDAASVTRQNHLPARILRGISTAVIALICIVAFWLFAVLIQPGALETPASQAEYSALTPYNSQLSP